MVNKVEEFLADARAQEESMGRQRELEMAESRSREARRLQAREQAKVPNRAVRL